MIGERVRRCRGCDVRLPADTDPRRLYHDDACRARSRGRRHNRRVARLDSARVQAERSALACVRCGRALAATARGRRPKYCGQRCKESARLDANRIRRTVAA